MNWLQTTILSLCVSVCERVVKKKTVQSVLSLLNVTELFGIESERCFVCYIVLN